MPVTIEAQLSSGCIDKLHHHLCYAAVSWLTAEMSTFGLVILFHALLVTDRCPGGHIISNCNARPTCMNSGIILTYS